jgi:hypothetical protein
MSRVKDNKEKEFYIRKTFEYGWTRDVLIHQIEAEKTGLGGGQESYLTGRVGPQELWVCMKREIRAGQKETNNSFCWEQGELFFNIFVIGEFECQLR